MLKAGRSMLMRKPSQHERSCEVLEPYDFKLDKTYHEYVADIKVFHDTGGRLLTGTDTPIPF